MRLFDPTGIKAKDYKATYPELDRTPEFEPLNGSALAFVWYYANRTSPLIDLPDENRLEESLDKSGYRPHDKERFFDLKFDEVMEIAIQKMASFIPGARYFAWKGLKATFQNYQDILQKSPEEFSKVTVKGSGEDRVEQNEVDYNAYANVTAKIAAALPGLVNKLEEGFGITLNASEEEEEGTDLIRAWNQNK